MTVTRERVLSMLNGHYQSLQPTTVGTGLDPYSQETYRDYAMAWAVYSIALSRLHTMRGDDETLLLCQACLRKLEALAATPAINCWGPPFEWKGFPAGTPMASTTVIVGEAFAQPYDATGSDADKERAIAICHWLVSELPWTRVDERACPWYGIEWPVLVVNVACMVGALLLEVGTQSGIDAFLEHGLAAFRYTCAQQHACGFWPYAQESDLLPNAHEIVDAVHTAFVLQGLARMADSLTQLGYGNESEQARKQLSTGTRFLIDHLVDDEGLREKVLVLPAQRVGEMHHRSSASRTWPVVSLEDGLVLVHQPGPARLWSLGSVLSALSVCVGPGCDSARSVLIESLKRLQQPDGRFRYTADDEANYVRHESFAFLGLVDALEASGRTEPSQSYSSNRRAEDAAPSRGIIDQSAEAPRLDPILDTHGGARRRHVVIIVDSLGEERCLREAAILVAAGLRVTIVGATARPASPHGHGIEIVEVRRRGRRSRWMRSALRSWRIRPDYIHAHSPTGLVLLVRAIASLRGIRFMSDFNDILVVESTVSDRAYFEQKALWGGPLSPEEEARLGEMLDVIPKDVRSVLDVGCGDGRLTNRLTERTAGLPLRVVGVDQSAEALQYVRTERRLANADALPFSDDEFDVVMATELIEHLPRRAYRRTLRELKRVSRLYIIVSVPNSENLRLGRTRCARCGKRFHVNGHLRSYSAKRLRWIFGQSATCEQLRFVGGDRLQYSPLLLSIRQHIGGYWPRSKTTVCPQCGARLLMSDTVEVNAIRRWCDQRNKRSGARKPAKRRHMVAVFKKIDV